MTHDRFRRLRAVLRTAVTWGGAWALAGGALATIVGLFEPNAGIESLAERLGLSMLGGIMWGIRFGLAGAVIGTVFSSVVRARYSGRRLSDIDPVRFSMLGAMVGGVGVPLYLQAMNVLSGGGPIAWGLVLDDAPLAALLGAAAAAGSILLARRADALPHGTRPDPLGNATPPLALPEAEQREIPIAQRARSVQSLGGRSGDV